MTKTVAENQVIVIGGYSTLKAWHFTAGGVVGADTDEQCQNSINDG
jgi:hypothetical protein